VWLEGGRRWKDAISNPRRSGFNGLVRCPESRGPLVWRSIPPPLQMTRSLPKLLPRTAYPPVKTLRSHRISTMRLHTRLVERRARILEVSRRSEHHHSMEVRVSRYMESTMRTRLPACRALCGQSLITRCRVLPLSGHSRSSEPQYASQQAKARRNQKRRTIIFPTA
jgi:hypothetical protein